MFPGDVGRPVGRDEREEVQLIEVVKDSAEELCTIMVEVEIAARAEKAAALLALNHTLMKRCYKIQITMGLPSCPQKVEHAILNTGTGPDLIRLDEMDEIWIASATRIKPEGLCQSAGTPLRVL